MINEDVRHIVEAELQPGETLLWADKPHERPITSHGLFRGGMHIFGLIFILIWTFLALIENNYANLALKLTFVLFGIAFFLFALAMRHQPLKHLFGPAKEVYGLTNKRGIIISPYWRKEVATIPAEKALDLSLSGNMEIGTIQFNQVRVKNRFGIAGNPRYWDVFDLSWKSDLGSFHKVRNPLEIQRLINRTFLQGHTP